MENKLYIGYECLLHIMSLDVLDKIDRAKTKMRESLGHLTPESLEHTLKRKLNDNKTNS